MKDYMRIYVKVVSLTDKMGFLHPKEIIWGDGRVFAIDSVRDFRPASEIARELPGDCYTVMIQGKQRFLFFERADERVPCLFGRWFVETALAR